MTKIKYYCGHTITCDCDPLQKQTAVEWLNRQIRLDSKIKENSKGAISYTLGLSKIDELLDQAKAMEKEQIKDAYNHDRPFLLCYEKGTAFKEYYNKTFKSE